MPLAREVEYWQGVSAKCVTAEGQILFDNVWKRPEQLKRLLKYPWIKERVLEIGTGNAMIAGALQVAVQGHWKYTGTELAPHFRNAAKTMFQLNVLEADVLELPGSDYTRIIALDSLEHVRPEHRGAGYAKMAEVAARDALLFLHYSNSVSCHDSEFDHPFGLADLMELEKVAFCMLTYERYPCFNHRAQEMMDYVFVVMQKC